MEYVERRKRADQWVRFEISTNGTLLGSREAEFLDDHDVDVQLSFDGTEPAQRLRGPGTFRLLDALLGRMRRERALYFARRFSVGLTVTPRNASYLADSVEYFIDSGVPRISLNPVLTQHAGWRVNDMVTLDGQFSRLVAVSRRHYDQTGEVPLGLFRRVGGRERLPMSSWLCGAGGGESLTVDVDGEVSGCVLFARSYERFSAMPLGRLLAGIRLGRIDDPALAARLARYNQMLKATGVFHNRGRKHSSLGRCAACSCRSECVVCPMSIVFQPGNANPNRIPDFICAFNRVAAKYRRCLPALPDPSAVATGREQVPKAVRRVVTRANAAARAARAVRL